MNRQPVSIDIRRDHHVHTSLCHHAVGAMEDYVRAAIARGLQQLVFLEHMECGVNYFQTTWLSDEDFDTYFREGERLRKKYSNRLDIGLGVELGYNPDEKDQLLQRLEKRHWDQIGVSYHYCRQPGLARHLNLVSRKGSNIEAILQAGSDQLLHRYFDTLIEAVHVLPGTILCHLDAGLRYVPDLQVSESHVAKIECLLDAVKARGMCLEINTSGLDIRGEAFPAAPIVEMAIARAIPLLASSDAHRPEDVGRYFDRLPDLLNAGIHP